MPIYNTDEAVLREAMESILTQTFSEFEYLIVNDSPDNKRLDEVVESYDDSRIIYIKNEKNIGLEESTNKLIDMSRGEYLAIFDHDDISLPTRLEEEVKYLDAHPKVGVCSAQFRVFGKENWTSDNPIESEDIKRSLEEISCVSHSAAMFRKSVLIENNIRYEKKFFPAASYRIITQLALVAEIHNLSEVLLEYRMSDNNTSILYDKKRAASRKKIGLEYSEKRKCLKVQDTFQFDKVVNIGRNITLGETQYYKATKNNENFFVKSGLHSYEDEFNYLKEVYSKNNKYFLKPIDFHNNDMNYLVMEWSDGGVNLDEYLGTGKISKEQRDTLIKDLYEIFEILRDSHIVHRDIIPRNFMVINGHLLLIDFYWAVKSNDYKEYEYIEEDIRALRLLGEDFAAGIYKWDDAYSFVKIGEYIAGKSNSSNSFIKKMSMDIGQRVIIPAPFVFDKTITKQVDLNEQLYRSMNELQLQNEDLSRENSELQLQNEDLSRENSELLYHNTEMRKSLSWAITKPLRFAKRTLKKIL